MEVIGTFTSDAYLVVGVSSTFTANSVIKRVVSITTRTANARFKKSNERFFGADSVVFDPSSPFFTADALLADLVHADTFTRTDTVIGTPDIGGYLPVSTSILTIDGDALVAGSQNSTFIYPASRSDQQLVVLDFYVSGTDEYQSYQVFMPPWQHTDGLFYQQTFYIEELSSNNWRLGDNNNNVTFATTPGSWYTVKAFSNVTAPFNEPTRRAAAKVWKRGDPEPAEWMLLTTSFLSDSVSSVQSRIELYRSTSVVVSKIDNLYIYNVGPRYYNQTFADAVIEGLPAGTIGRAFTANARLEPGINKTRFYLPSEGSAGIDLSIGPDWQGGSQNVKPAPTIKTNTPQLAVTATETDLEPGNYILGQFVSAPLAEQTINGQYRGIIGVRRPSTTSGSYMRYTVKVVGSDGSLKQTIIPITDATGSNTFQSGTTFFTRLIPNYISVSGPHGWIPVPEFSVDRGDRLLFEVGAYHAARTATSSSSIALFGDPLVVSDYPYTNAINHTTSPGTAWVEFDTTIIFDELAFTANSILKKAINGAFTANASIVAPFVEGSFTADAWFFKTVSRTFTSDAFIVSTATLSQFTANASIVDLDKINYFRANSIIYRPVVRPEDRVYTRTVTLTVLEKRKKPLPAYIPPRDNNEDDEPEEPLLQPNCLPACEPVGAGIGTGYGAAGSAIRKTIRYCSSCNGNYSFTDNNWIGLGRSGVSTGSHPGCSGTHFEGDHKQRIWVQYANIPTVRFALKAKLSWLASAGDRATVRVHGNVSLPSLEGGEWLPYDPDYHLNQWGGGDFLGTMTFIANGGGGTSDGPTYALQQEATALFIDPGALRTDTFRFEMDDEITSYKAIFVAPTKEEVFD